MSLLLFERFGVDGVSVQDAAVLSLYSVGRVSGCVVDLGHSKTDIAPVYEGLLRTQGIRRLDICGQSLTESLKQHLSHSNFKNEVLDKIKESVIRVNENEEGSEMQEDPIYTLPDGETITIPYQEATRLGEALFSPEVLQLTCPGIADAMYSATFGQSDIPSKRQHLEGIMLSGGGSAIPNLQSRLFRELQCLVPHSIQPGFCATPEYMPATTQKYASWMGGAILSKVVTQHGHLATKSDYDEIGPAVLHRKFQTAF